MWIHPASPFPRLCFRSRLRKPYTFELCVLISPNPSCNRHGTKVHVPDASKGPNSKRQSLEPGKFYRRGRWETRSQTHPREVQSSGSFYFPGRGWEEQGGQVTAGQTPFLGPLDRLCPRRASCRSPRPGLGCLPRRAWHTGALREHELQDQLHPCSPGAAAPAGLGFPIRRGSPAARQQRSTVEARVASLSAPGPHPLPAQTRREQRPARPYVLRSPGRLSSRGVLWPPPLPSDLSAARLGSPGAAFGHSPGPARRSRCFHGLFSSFCGFCFRFWTQSSTLVDVPKLLG